MIKELIQTWSVFVDGYANAKTDQAPDLVIWPTPLGSRHGFTGALSDRRRQGRINFMVVRRETDGMICHPEHGEYQSRFVGRFCCCGQVGRATWSAFNDGSKDGCRPVSERYWTMATSHRGYHRWAFKTMIRLEMA
jgi:hypothetical protein